MRRMAGYLINSSEPVSLVTGEQVRLPNGFVFVDVLPGSSGVFILVPNGLPSAAYITAADWDGLVARKEAIPDPLPRILVNPQP